MSSNVQNQIKRATREYEIALDNASRKRQALSLLQEELREINTLDTKKTDRLESAVKSAQILMNKKQEALNEAQERATKAREQYMKLEDEFQIETKRLRDLQDKQRQVLERKISRETQEEKMWSMKADNAQRDMDIFRRQNEDRVKQKQRESDTAGRRQTYY